MRHSTGAPKTHGSATADTNAGAMPLELLERDQVLASVMPGHGDPPPGGDESGPEDETEEEEEPEGDPS